MSRVVPTLVAVLAVVGCSKGEKGDMGSMGGTGSTGTAGPSGDAGPAGAAGPAGDAGAAGANGAAGPAGDAGAAGAAGASTGTVTGSVKDTNNVGLQSVTISTSPTSGTTSTDSSGNFSLASVPSGVYSVIASYAGYGTSTVTGVSVTTGGASSTSFVLYLSDGGFASISGTVKNTAGAAIANATVRASGVDASAVTDSTGSYTLASIPAPGPYFLDVTPPTSDADAGYFAGDTRIGLLLTRATHTDASIVLSARPTGAATYIGTALCTACHTSSGIASSHASSAHWRSLSLDGGERFINTSLWPSVGGTVDTAIYAQDPNGVKYDAGNGGSGWNRVYLCQNSAGSYAMMFGPNPDAGVDAGCTGTGGATQGILIPVAGTYGGEGDRATWDGGIVSNLGKFKQRFLAKVNDVDAGLGWTYATGKDKDLLILPVQVTQSGDGNPKFAVYKETEWANRDRTFAYACSGCHNTNLNIVWDQAGGKDYITSYSYTDLNLGCEKCHGPGSEHLAAGGGLAKAIINPKHLNADRERQVCGQCHSGDKGKNAGGNTKYGYAYNLNYADAGTTTTIGKGTYVPGFHDIKDFISNYESGGSFDAWTTIYGTVYGKAHRQQYTMLLKSKHVNNTSRRMTCASCHDVHSLYQGPKAHTVTSGSDTFVFATPRFNNNVLCLSCHAGSGEFATMATADVAAIHVGDSRAVSKNGSNQSFTSGEIASALERVGDVVETHMNAKANMGVFVMYDPEREPGVGRCMNCHMPRTAKSGGWTTGKDETGKTALIEGDQGSHVFDIIAPQKSRVMTDGGVTDDKVMPNSCGPCHARYRFSGDGQ